MRIGFITQLLWQRYGPFWVRLLEETGATSHLPEPDSTLEHLSDPRVESVPGLAFQLAVAQALSLSDCDLLVVPSLNYGNEAARGGGQDPWIADFPAALTAIGGLPPLLGVPAWLDQAHEPLMIEALQQVGRDAGRIRRIWDRHRADLHPPRVKGPGWGPTPAGKKGIGVVSQPWLAGPQLTRRAAGEEMQAVGQHRLDPADAREEGARVDERTALTDREVLGAARIFARRGAIEEIHLVVDPTSGSDLWLTSRVRRVSGKPVVVHELPDLLGEDGAAELLMTGARST